MNEDSEEAPKPPSAAGRPHLGLGSVGKPWLTAKANGGYTAGVWVRTPRGKNKQVTASGRTKGAAQRELQRKLTNLVEPVPGGITASLSVADLADHWQKRKQRDGHARRGTPLTPQILWGYDREIRAIIKPTFGDLRIGEIEIAVVQAALDELEDAGISTVRARGLLGPMFDLALRDGAMRVNPMSYIRPPAREAKEVEALDVATAHLLLRVAHPHFQRKPGVRGPSRDLHDFVLLGLGTGARIGELLAAQVKHAFLETDTPTLTISGTLVEPRTGFIDKHHRQEKTKNSQVRVLVLPDAAADMLRARLAASPYQEPDDPLLASNQGTFIWAANIRQRLRKAIADEPRLLGTTPHTLRRTVASRIAYDMGLDAARRQLGHSVAGATSLAPYIEHQQQVPDYRHVLDKFFETE